MDEIKYPKVRMLYDGILTTVNAEEMTEAKIDLSALNDGLGDVLSRQTVVAAGPNAIAKPGDEVEVDLYSFPKKLVKEAKFDIGKDQYSIMLPIVDIDGEIYLHISSRELKWIYE
jgi:hypothetical protein